MATSRPQPGVPSLRSRIITAIVIVGAFLIATASAAATFYTDALWFIDVGHGAVFWTRFWSSIGVGVAFGVASFIIIYVNLVVARRLRPRVSVAPVLPGLAPSPQQQVEEVLSRVRSTLEPFAPWVLLLLAIVVAWGIGQSMSSGWETIRLALSGATFGVKDPQFGLDVGFFVFRLPALRIVADWLFSTLVLTLFLVVAVHLYEGGIRPAQRLRGIDPHVKAHVSVVLGLIVASKVFDYWLSIYELDLSARGQVVGASYTDVHAQIPAYFILIGIAVITAVLLMLNIRYRGWRLPIVALGAWIAASLLVGAVYPAIVQSLVVSPNELAVEKPYILRNITDTRQAFDLESIDATAFPAAEDLTSSDIAEATSTVRNIRLWDPNVVVDSYKQLQEIRFYYDFKGVDIDRYTIDGSMQQVLVSARELNVDNLAAQAKTWINTHLVYTHGYGVVMSPVNSTTAGLPDFIIENIPPRSSTDLKVTVPGIYYGQETNSYAIVDTKQKEFDYPVGGANATTSYSGDNGIPIGSLTNRLAFAIRTGDVEILFSNAITPTSRMLFQRSITERVHALAPWLRLDSDPYPVVVGGRVLWLLDGYTTSSAYPYSQPDPATGVNYIRNSVKVTVDAYDGKVTLYAFDPHDPVLAAYEKLFPGLLTDVSKMPAAVRAHLRYPEDLFKIQASTYETYHMLDPQVFYNKEDQWAVPGARTSAPMQPFYVLMRLPGVATEQFLLMQPFTPLNKDNMIGWMAASSDPGDYGHRLVYNFPKSQLILGPEQIKARLNQEPSISTQLTLLNQQGSRVIFGNLLVIPIKDSILYVQPVYIQAEQSPMPQLERVIVDYSDSISMAPDLKTALTQVFGAAPSDAESLTSSTVAPGQATTSTTGAPATGTNAALLKQASDLYSAAIAAQKAGDWASYGTDINRLGQIIDQLAKPSATVTKTP